MGVYKLLKIVDLDVVNEISLKEAKDFKILPIYMDKDKVFVATYNKDKRANELLNFIYKKDISFIDISEEVLEDLTNILLNYSIRDIYEKIIEEAINLKASDIHFEPMENTLRIRMRINGTLILKRILKLKDYSVILSKYKINANMDITEKRKPQDGKISYLYNKEKYNLRLSTIPVIAGEKLVIRILYEDKDLGNIEKLDFNKKQLEKLKKIISLNNGLVLVTGPTGSGKSTTLYSILNSLDKEVLNITTLEDPIEMSIKGINQINLNPKIGITFGAGLRSILRQDPDIIMVGEVRDEETAKMAVRASITGHKVYSTIHTKNPMEVYLRLQEMGVEEYLLRDSLCGIISQRLIKVICNDCKEKIRSINLNDRNVTLYRKKGCRNCDDTGYIGRRLVSSVNYIDKNIIKSLRDKNFNHNLLSNKEMLDVLKGLLIAEVIDFYDFLKFIEGEELDEKELQSFRNYL